MHSNRCKFIPKMHQNTFGGSTPFPDPLATVKGVPAIYVAHYILVLQGPEVQVYNEPHK